MNKLTLAPLLLIASACTTFSHKSGDGDSLVTEGQSTVVFQSGQEEPVVAGHDRQYYLDQRQAKDALARMRGSLATGEPEAAIELAKARLAKQPGDVEALTALTSGLALTRNYSLAAYYATQLERLQPGNPVALNVKGLAAMLAPKSRLGDFKLAMSYFQQSFDADQTQIAAGLNLANLQLEMGHAQVAAATFTKVSQRCGQCIPALMGQGVALSRSHQFKPAEAAFQEVLNKKPNHPGALYNLALVYKNGYNNPKQAEKYLFALLNDSHTKNVALRERAQIVLRMIKGEAGAEERTAVADDEKTDQNQKDDPKDAELLMTGAPADKDE